MLKIIVILVFMYNVVNTVSDPSAKNMIVNICLLAIALGLVLSTSKKVVSIILKVVAVTAIIAYALIYFGVLAI